MMTVASIRAAAVSKLETDRGYPIIEVDIRDWWRDANILQKAHPSIGRTDCHQTYALLGLTVGRDF